MHYDIINKYYFSDRSLKSFYCCFMKYNAREACTYTLIYSHLPVALQDMVGLVERIMKIVRAPHVPVGDSFMRPSEEPEFFPNRQCSIIFKGKEIGDFGIVHPEVLKKFGIPDPCSFVKIDVQALL
ncbi:phenylalanine--tRNA ligase beta subunit, cytoplasmic-like [Ananas comosus]|uniref:Phenylalanine--tRNA ligase beta subunit, cytoplasmic-like n=1 Tax=Ananas comosus TaxID=4615 RepID=A0A6P5GGD7_ANACO|nr:phenylalanine--tRNA ligase beta subunit, cytoplasmic-like [Ananas comosus]